MPSSTSSSNHLSLLSCGVRWPWRIPLREDLLVQKKQARLFIVKVLIFVCMFMVFDRMTGKFLEMGLDRSYGLDVPAEVLCVGHSHTGLGIDRTILENALGVKVAKYARNGANLSDRYVMIQQYLERQPSSVRVIVYDVSAHTFTGSGLSQNSYTLFYPFMHSPSIREYVREHAPPLDYYIRRIVRLRRFNLETCNAAIRGWLRMWANLKHGQVDVSRLEKQIAAGQIRRISFDQECIDLLDQTIEFVATQGIKLVLLYIPTLDIHNAAQPQEYHRAIQMLRGRAARSDSVTFLYYNPAFAHRRELFYDPIHLNPQGQHLVTERLAHDLKAILKETPDRQPAYVSTN